MIVVGLDVGQRSLGVALIHDDGSFSKSYYAENTFESRIKVAESVLTDDMQLKGEDPAIVVIEEYIKGPTSFVGFGMGENGGIYRTLCYEAGFNILLCPVPLMRGFYGLRSGGKGKSKRKEGKELLRKVLKPVFPKHVMTSLDARGQEDEVDALAYALIGRCFINSDGFELTEKQRNILKSLEADYYIGGRNGKI